MIFSKYSPSRTLVARNFLLYTLAVLPMCCCLIVATLAIADGSECKKPGVKQYTLKFDSRSTSPVASYSENYPDERRPGGPTALPDEYKAFCESRKKAIEKSLDEAKAANESKILFMSPYYCDDKKNFLDAKVTWNSPEFKFCVSDYSNPSKFYPLHSEGSMTSRLVITCKCPDRMMAKTCGAELAY